MIKKKFNEKNDSFLHESFFWSQSLDIMLKIKIEKILYTSSYIGSSIAEPISGFLSTFRILVNNNFEETLNATWYKLFYINNIFIKQIMNKNNKNAYENPNILVISLKSRQLRITLQSTNKTIYNISVGRILSSLKIFEKAKKKSNKGERLFLEYLNNFLQENIEKFGKQKTTIFKINHFKKYFPMEEQIYKICNKYLSIFYNIIEMRIPNNFFKYKKIRSIKRRLKKRIIKNENALNNF
uniref:Ymf61 n=1 Tax=Tetrahymena rostrata TaxID=5909 RepID=A0A6G5NK91_TETRO|nr:Ymf61 [Tetrahymena rostrata]QBI37938.1 Ymf61 [Tetrahymena rostrata]URP31129.1 Ymf61 [Tetrahymena rostrata]